MGTPSTAPLTARSHGARSALSSEAEEEVADDRRPREERVMPGVDLDRPIGAAGELALPLGRRAAVPRADEVGRRDLAPDRRLDRLLRHLHALAHEARGRL